jgi:tetratricopeptide (TPR) repeat protein
MPEQWLSTIRDAAAKAWDFAGGALLPLLGAAALLLCLKWWWQRRHAIVFEPWLDRTGGEAGDLGHSLASLLLHRIREIQSVHERSIRRFELWNPSYEVPAFQQPIDDEIKLLASLELGRYGELVGRVATLLFKLLPLAQPAKLRGTALTLGDHLFLQLTLDGFRTKADGRRVMRVLEARGKAGESSTLPELVEELAYKVYLELSESPHFKSWRALKAWVAGLSHFVEFLDVESDDAWDKARDCYEEALRHERNNAAASYNLGVLHYVRLSGKDNALAIERFRAASLCADVELKAYALSGLANAQGQAFHRHGIAEPRLIEEARFHAARALDLAPDKDVVQKAYAFICHQDSERLAQQAAAETGATRAALLEEAGRQRDTAIRHYQLATRANPLYFAAWNNLGNLHLEWARQLPAGDPRRRARLAEALRHCETAIKARAAYPLPYDNAANAWIELAALSARPEERTAALDRAEEFLKNALLNQPRYAEAMNDWARLELLRRPDDAAAGLDRHAAALDRCDPAADDGRRKKLSRQLAPELAAATVAATPATQPLLAKLKELGCSCRLP